MNVNISACQSALDDLIAVVDKIESDSYENELEQPFSREGIGTCTVTAIWLARKLGGQIAGYHIDDNPTALLGQIEGGHDFCLIDRRFIVDWWATQYADTDPIHPGVLDLARRADAHWAKRWYGERTRWTVRTP